MSDSNWTQSHRALILPGMHKKVSNGRSLNLKFFDVHNDDFEKDI